MNFDLSKIYSEQVNKQRVYLNPYIKHGLVNEAVNCSAGDTPKALTADTDSAANRTVGLLLEKLNPTVFSTHNNCMRIFKNIEMTTAQFVKSYLSKLADQVNFIRSIAIDENYIEAGQPYKGKVLSSQVDHVLYKITYNPLPYPSQTKRQEAVEKLTLGQLQQAVFDADTKEVTVMGVIGLAGKVEKAFGTPVKENLPGLIYNLKMGKDLYLQNDVDVMAFFDSIIPKGKLDPASFGSIPELAQRQCTISLNAFKTKMQKSDSPKVKLPGDQRNMINGSISIPKALIEAGFTPENYEYVAGADNIPDSPHAYLKKIGAKLSGKQADEWCPADIFIVPKSMHDNGLESLVENELKQVPAGSPGDNTAKLTKLHSLFAQEFKADAVNETTPILAISLKQESGRGGKAKNYIRQKLLPTVENEEEVVPGCDVNMTAFEQNPTANDPEQAGVNGSNRDFWLNGDENHLGITGMLNNITSIVNKKSEFLRFDARQPILDFNANVNQLSRGKNIDKYLFGKYGALKALNCILEYAEPGVFLEILKAGRKIDEGAPAFFKMVESTKGRPASIENQYQLQVDVHYPLIITNVYNPTYKGLEILINTTERSGSYEKDKPWKIVMTTQKTNAKQIEIETAPGKAIK